MDDLISRQAAIDALGGEPIAYTEYEAGLQDKWIDAKENIEALPSAQPEIILCKDCKHGSRAFGGGCRFHWWDALKPEYMNSNDYCSRAERKEE